MPVHTCAVKGISLNIDVVYSHLALSMRRPPTGLLESLYPDRSLILKGPFDDFRESQHIQGRSVRHWCSIQHFIHRIIHSTPGKAEKAWFARDKAQTVAEVPW